MLRLDDGSHLTQAAQRSQPGGAPTLITKRQRPPTLAADCDEGRSEFLDGRLAPHDQIRASHVGGTPCRLAGNSLSLPANT
jgi:hypothetical protein